MRDPSGDQRWSASPNSPVVTAVGVVFSLAVAGTAMVQMWEGRSRSTKPSPGMPLARYTASVITRTSLSLGLSPDGLSPEGFAAAVRSAGRAVEEKAMVLPSGAHSGLPAPRGMSVMAHGSPPCIDMT